MNSQVFQGETSHVRMAPRRHAFRYAALWLCLDVAELNILDRQVGNFGYNRRALVSICDQDYGTPGRGTIREKIEATIRAAGVTAQLDRIRMVTVPRVAGYVFNPVSFYLCNDQRGAMVVLVAEVRNTFGEKHLYVVEPAHLLRPHATSVTFRFPKQFYVSPFFEVEGEYVIVVTELDNTFSLRIDLKRAGELVFAASLVGHGEPLTTQSLRRSLTRQPLFAATVMIKVHWQALRLYCQRRLPMYDKPELNKGSIISADANHFWHRFRAALVSRARRDSSGTTLPSDLLSLERDS